MFFIYSGFSDLQPGSKTGMGGNTSGLLLAGLSLCYMSLQWQVTPFFTSSNSI
ncbi:MAG: hypothetical protein ACI832_001292 [Rheinheimera aquimaris]